VKKPDIRIDSTIHSRGYENQRHLEFGPDLPETQPLRRPQIFIAAIATAVNEVISGVRSVDQLQNVLNEHVYESLKNKGCFQSPVSVETREKTSGSTNRCGAREIPVSERGGNRIGCGS
jgi:hypothetical protein